jgi:hypothetical protein
MMLRQRLLRAGITIGAAAATVLGMTSTAHAAPASFTAASIHGGGTGALAAEAVGGISWYNRSVTLTSVRFYVTAQECGHFTVQAWQGNLKVDSFAPPKQCATTAGRWISYGDVPLYAGGLSGGITEVVIDAYDDTHSGNGWADCSRTASSCTTWPR